MSNVATGPTRRRLVNGAICFLTIAGGVLLFGAGAYRVFVHPDLAAADALGLLWPFFLAGTAGVGLGWWLDRAEG